MNEINSFTFYKNYYDLLDNLPTEDKRLMLEVIVDYIFRDVIHEHVQWAFYVTGLRFKEKHIEWEEGWKT